MHIGEVLNRVYDEEVGWRPASGSIKPVHVANGLIRVLSGQQFDVDRLHRFVVWWKAGKRPDENRSYEALVREDPVFESVSRTSEGFDHTRRFLGGLLNADSGLYPSTSKSDPTLTCVQMASRSGNDRGLGEFGALLFRSGERSRPLVDAVVSAARSERPQDPITAAVWPLLEPEGRASKGGSKRAASLNRSHSAAFVKAYQEAAGDLASHEFAQGNRLRTLERAVQFLCIAPFVHAQALAANGDMDARAPMLLAMGGGRSDEVIVASEKSLQFLYERFEHWLAERLSERIARGMPLDDSGTVLEVSADGRHVRRLFREIGAATTGHAEPSDEILRARMAAFEEARHEFGREDAPRVLGHALVSAYLQEYASGGPREFLRALGSRIGLVYPHFQGRGARRLRPSAPVLDTLVRACVPATTSISLPEFLQRLWERFGLVVGGLRSESRDDVEALYSHGIAVDALALNSNAELLVTQLEAMGLARRYADNVTFIGDTHAV